MTEQEKQRLFRLRIDGYTENIRQAYEDTIDEIMDLYRRVDFNPDKPFVFKDYPKLSEEYTVIQRNLYSRMYGEIKNGIVTEWINSNVVTDALISSYLGKNASDKVFSKYFNRNVEALNAHFSRNDKEGLNLSQRVWRNTSQFKEEIEMAVDIGLRDGRSAAQLSRDIRKYLDEPDKLFRRVRKEHGELHLSKRAKAYHPGQGNYRSSAKNAARLARTEINTAYREADVQRWQSMDFVLGYEVKRSNRYDNSCKVCEALMGKYPKEFKFVGWHPQCLCYATPILKPKDEFIQLQKKLLAGDDISDYKSVNEVTQLPDSFTSWISQNNDKLIAAKSKPYFIRDNFKVDSEKLQYIHGTNSVGKEPYKYSEKSARKLGYFTNGKLEKEFNNVLPGFDLKEFDNDLMRISNKYGINITKKHLSAYQGEVILSYEGAGDFSLKRSFAKNIAYHDLLKVPIDAQGKGFSKELFQSLYKQYQNAGIREIRVTANIDVGGYTWAKYGFSAKAESYDDIMSWAKWQRNDKCITKDNYESFSKWIEPYKGKDIPMWKLANMPYGKKLLLGSNWNGVIDLKNDVQREIFEKYLR